MRSRDPFDSGFQETKSTAFHDFPSHRPSRWFRGVLVALVFLAPVGWSASTGSQSRIACAQDRVLVQKRNSDGSQSLPGRIVDYNGQFLTLERVGGRMEQIASARVLETHTNRTAPHVQADHWLANHQFEKALQSYQQAIQEETRKWVRQQILAQWVWCYRSQGMVEHAGDAFLKLVLAGDPKTLYFHAIPLSWARETVSPALEGRAQEWLANSASSASRLMGASWLLGTVQRDLAIQVLKQLATQDDPRIGLLAEMQLWRTQQATVSVQELKQWKQQVARLEVSLRAGPYYVLATGLARHDQHEPAIVNWMRVPVNYPRQFHLASESLLGAARSLEALDRAAQAQGLYQEITRKYVDTIAAEQARRWLSQAGIGKPSTTNP